MKKYKNIILGMAAVLGLACTSCEDYLDINTNPNYPGTADMKVLLPSAEASTIARIGLDGDLLGSMFAQFTTQGHTTNQYNTVTSYTLNVSSYNTIWNNAYANTLPDLKLVLKEAEETGAWNYWVVAKILTAYTYSYLTDFYEDIPFTEALNPEIAKPKYDDSKSVVYPGILKMLDEAIAKAPEAGKSPVKLTKQDPIFGGDINKWVSFAKSLQMKLMLRDFKANETKLLALANAGDLLAVDCKFAIFEDATNKGNPFYEYNIRQLNTTENVRASHTMVEFLLVNNDVRIDKFYEPTYEAAQQLAAGKQLKMAETYEGLPYGARPETSVIPLVQTSRFKQSYADPVYLMTAAEVKFMQAEIYARASQADVAKAKSAYDEAVIAAFARLGHDGSAYVADGGVYAFKSGSVDEMMTCIMTQKWVSYCKANSWDAWFDRNRTGIPAISEEVVRVSDKFNERTLTEGYVLGTLAPSGQSALPTGMYPQRLLVPASSSTYNSNAPKSKELTAKMWWAK